MADYRITVKVRNARILDAIKKAGYRPGAPFAKLVGIPYVILLEYISCKRVPFDEDGNLIPCAEKLCIFFNKLPNDLWSSKQLTPLLKNNVEKDIEEVNIDSLLNNASEDLGLLENMVQDEAFKLIHDGIDSLPPKHAEVIRRRFGIGFKEHTLKEIADIFGVVPQRIRQIERDALRRLRHPSRELDKIADAYNMTHVYVSEASRLYAMQAHLNNGEGLFCIRQIYQLLQENPYLVVQYEIKQTISRNWTKIRENPEICKQLQSIRLLEQIRVDSLSHPIERSRLEAGVYVTIYDRLTALFSDEFKGVALFNIFTLIETGMDALTSNCPDSQSITTFNRMMNSLHLSERQVSKFQNAIADIIQEANESFLQISNRF